MQSSKVTKVKPWLHQLQFIKWQQSENDTKSCSNSGSGASHGPIIKSKWTIFKAEFVLYETLHLYDISLNYWLDLTCFVSYHFWIFYFYFAWAGITFLCCSMYLSGLLVTLPVCVLVSGFISFITLTCRLSFPVDQPLMSHLVPLFVCSCRSCSPRGLIVSLPAWSLVSVS